MSSTLSQADAVMIMIAATETFLSLPWEELPPGHRFGAVVLYDQLITRARRELPADLEREFPGFSDSLNQAHALAERIRHAAGVPRRM